MSDEEDYDIFNNETFGDNVEEFDWEADHDHLSNIIELEKKRESLLDNDDSDWDENKLIDMLTMGIAHRNNNLSNNNYSNANTNQQNEYVLFPNCGNRNNNVDSVSNISVPFDSICATSNSSYPFKSSPHWDSDDLDDAKLEEQVNNFCFSSLPRSQWKPFSGKSNIGNHLSNDLAISFDFIDSSYDDEKKIDEMLSRPTQQECYSNKSSIASSANSVLNRQPTVSLLSGSSCSSLSVDDLNFESILQSPMKAKISDDDTTTVESKQKLSKSSSLLLIPPQIIDVEAILYSLKMTNSNTMSDCLSDHDEYAGLMSDREKYWLAGIQLLPVNNMQPFKDDYYFTIYQMRRCSRKKLYAMVKDNNNANAGKKQQTVTRDYTPMEFENSLGKVQIGSALAPRKVIDTYDIKCSKSESSCCENSGETVVCNAVVKSPSSHLKKILLKIEDIYAKLLAYEDMINNRASVSSFVGVNNNVKCCNNKDDASRQPNDSNNGNEDASGVVEINDGEHSKQLTPNVIVANIYEHLIGSSKSDFISYMSVRKGRRLVLRFLAYCKNPHDIWITIFEHFDEIIAYDKYDGLLYSYLPYHRSWLMTIPSLSFLIKMAECLTYHLPMVLQNKFGVSLLANMVERAEVIFNVSKPKERTLWLNFVMYVAQKTNSRNVIKPVVCLNEHTLFNHLSKCRKINKEHVTNMINLFTNMTVN